MSEDLSGFHAKPPRRASLTEEKRLREAFAAELKANPDRAPGPVGLRRRMGLPHGYNLNGRMSVLRRRLLVEAGFTKVEHSNRWVKR